MSIRFSVSLNLVSSSLGVSGMGHLELTPATRPILARSNAIDAYANLENWLCLLLARLLGVEAKVAGIIFYRIANTRSRLAVLEAILKEMHGHDYSVFWNSLVREMKKIDETRNQIVHWHIHTITIGDYIPTEPRKIATMLVPPNIHAMGDNTPMIGETEMNAFIERAEFVGALISYFQAYLGGGIPEPILGSWRKIFHEPMTYPPPASHPLSQNPREH